MKIITTSWDDGSLHDCRLAELLHKYDLQATFYIPKCNSEREVIAENDIRQIATKYEIGGHTLNHIFLTTVPASTQWYEIQGCYLWLRDIIGITPKSFCAPKGLYDKSIINLVKKAGFINLRTTHLLDITGISSKNDFPLMHTTVQMYQHSRLTYLKHLVKRGKINSLANWLKMSTENELLALTEKTLALIRLKQKGCFHLWGHSWEIEKYGLWDKLEAVFSLLSNQQDFLYLQNKETTLQ